MYPQFSTEQKAAARALLDMHYPTQELVAAAVGTTRQSMTAWVNKWNWRFVDFRKTAARRAHDRLRLRLLREHGHNVSDMAKLEPLNVHELEEAPDAGAVEAVDYGVAGDGADGALVVEPLSPGERAERLSRLLLANTDMVIAAANRQGGVMTKPQVDTLLTMLRLAEKLEPLMAEQAREAAIRSDDEVAEIYEKLERRIEQRACLLAARTIRGLASPCETCGERVTDPNAAARALFLRSRTYGMHDEGIAALPGPDGPGQADPGRYGAELTRGLTPAPRP